MRAARTLLRPTKSNARSWGLIGCDVQMQAPPEEVLELPSDQSKQSLQPFWARLSCSISQPAVGACRPLRLLAAGC